VRDEKLARVFELSSDRSVEYWLGEAWFIKFDDYNLKVNFDYKSLACKKLTFGLFSF